MNPKKYSGKNSALVLFCIVTLGISLYLFKTNRDLSLQINNNQKSQSSQNQQNIADDLFGSINKTRFTAIDEPRYISGQEAQSFLQDSDVVYFFQGKDAMYVYPASVLTYYHIVNDVIDDRPVAVTLCALSNTSVMYSRKVNNQIHSFGISGQLLYGNLVMYDRETGSDWPQITGEAIRGQLKGQKLTMAGTMQQTNWKPIKNNPTLKVLTFPDEQKRDFVLGFYQQYRSAYIGVDSLQQKKTLDVRLPAYKRGFGLSSQASAKYYPDEAIRKNGIINDQIHNDPIVIVLDQRYGSTKIFQSIVDSKNLEFHKASNGFVDKQTNTLWNFDGLAVKGPLQGKKLKTANFLPAYWFAWSAFFPKTDYYQ